ncbi:MAG: tetratricopeptide repeat protein [Acidobacteria bacterium]|nr:tetratricopeptide repeat protein [Acidobacteriota bacterium]
MNSLLRLLAGVVFAQSDPGARIQEARALYHQAERLDSAGRLTEARETILLALERLKGAEEIDAALHGTLWLHRATLENNLGNYAGAEASYRRTLAIFETGKVQPEALVPALRGLGATLINLTRTLDAELVLKRAQAIAEKHLPPAHPQAASVLDALGLLYSNAGDLKRAERFTRRALEILEASLGARHPDVAAELTSLARLLTAQGHPGEALILLDRGIAIFDASRGAGHPDTIRAIYLRGLAQTRTEPAAAEQSFRDALNRWRASQPGGHPFAAQALSALARVREMRGDAKEALAFNEEALRIANAALGPEHLLVAQILLDRASMLKTAKRRKESSQAAKQAEAIRNAHGPQSLDRHKVDIWTLRTRLSKAKEMRTP